jgi:hypothetical protein
LAHARTNNNDARHPSRWVEYSYLQNCRGLRRPHHLSELAGTTGEEALMGSVSANRRSIVAATVR